MTKREAKLELAADAAKDLFQSLVESHVPDSDTKEQIESVVREIEQALYFDLY